MHALAKVRDNSSIPVMADESIHSPEDAVQLIQAEAVDLINVKLMKCGGILKARKIAAIAEAANIPCMIGCMGESKLGITAGVHVAAAIKNFQYADLDSDLSIRNKLVKKGAKIKNSKRIPTRESGLGIQKFNEKLLGEAVRIYR